MTPNEVYEQLDAEEIYVKFKWDNFGYQAGDVVKAKLNKGRDNRGLYVTMKSNEEDGGGDLFNAWLDLGSFRELNEMEVIAHFAAGLPVL